MAFRDFSLDIEWDVGTYGELLNKKVKNVDAFIKEIHERKTKIFMEIIEGGELKPRPGVIRFIRECHDNRLRLAVCSTSNERSVRTLLRTLLGETAYGWFEVILAGDMVKVKKEIGLRWPEALSPYTAL